MGRGLKRRRNDETFSMSESIALLAKIIYEREVAEENPPVFTFSQLRSIAEIKDERLRLFFDEIEESVCIREKNKEERKELDWSLAYQCYLMCWNRNKSIQLWNLWDEQLASKEFTWVDGVAILTNLLYDREKKQKQATIYSFRELRNEMENKDYRLSTFFDSIYNAANPLEKNGEYLEKLDKRLALECYFICGNRNSKLTAFKTDASIFLNSMGT